VAHAAPATGFSAWLSRPARPDELEEAQAVAAHSEQRLESVREKVIRPIHAKGNRNQFSDMIRGLMQGR
jgi:hypothetical protein